MLSLMIPCLFIIASNVPFFFFNSFINHFVSVCLSLINTLADNLWQFKNVQSYNTVQLC